MSLEKKKTDLINVLYFLSKLGAEKPGPIVLQLSPTSGGDVTSPVQLSLRRPLRHTAGASVGRRPQ